MKRSAPPSSAGWRPKHFHADDGERNESANTLMKVGNHSGASAAGGIVMVSNASSPTGFCSPCGNGLDVPASAAKWADEDAANKLIVKELNAMTLRDREKMFDGECIATTVSARELSSPNQRFSFSFAFALILYPTRKISTVYSRLPRKSKLR